MNLIVAVDYKWGIGKNNGLLFSIPEDMKYFRSMTQGKVVCMGYNTFLSFPSGKPLNNRANIILAPDGVKVEGTATVHSLPELFRLLKNYDTNDIFIIGGGMFYRTMLPYCTYAYVTEVYADGNATVFFEDLSKLENWKKSYLSAVQTYEDLSYRFVLYENSSPLAF